MTTIEFPFIKEELSENIQPSCHSNIFIKYFLCDKSIRPKISFSNTLRKVLLKRYRIAKRQFFEIKLNNKLCCVNFGDFPDFKFLAAYSNEIEVAFVSQLLTSQINTCYNFYEKYGIRIYPFPMPILFHVDQILNGWEYNTHSVKKYVANMRFNRKFRKSRTRWIKFSKKRPNLFNHQLRQTNDFLRSTTNDVQWGVNLRGRGRDGKCYRESEFMLMGVPLALDYIPFYPFPFKPNEQYILMEKPKDLLKLQDIDPRPYIAESKRIGNKYIRPSGMLSLMESLINQSSYSLTEFGAGTGTRTQNALPST